MRIYKNLFIYFLFLTLAIHTVKGQNLFDEKNTASFAQFLFMAGQYQLAFNEYSRLVNFDSNNVEYRLKQIESLRLGSHSNDALNLAKTYHTLFRNYDIEKEFYRLMILNNQFDELLVFLENNKLLNDTDKFVFSCSALILDNKFSSAKNLLTNNYNLLLPEYETFLRINNQCLLLKRKKPFVSGLMSSVVPGSGKIYSSYWQDGLLAFLYTTMSAWQTYRGFTKYGSKSVYGWFSAGLTAGFYFGNIFGSVKAAHKYNHQQSEKFHQQIEEIVIHY